MLLLNASTARGSTKLSRSGTANNSRGTGWEAEPDIFHCGTGMRHKTSETLFAYWNGVRGEQLAPRRFQIEPAKIAGILSSTFMLERLDTATYRYRLAGTAVCNLFGAELRGSNFLEGWPPEDHLSLMRRLSVVSGRGAVELIHLEAAPAGRASAPFELLLLPLRHTSETIDRILGSFVALDCPGWLGHAPLATKRMIANEFIWPAGSANGAAEARPIPARPNHAPLALNPRGGRIVRNERRQFRVFDGGLTPPNEDKT
jgi:hypothetical protein